MDTPEYVTVEEVKRVCKELKIRDWTELKAPDVSAEEAEIILAELNLEGMPVELEEFRKGLEVELEHGLMFKNANVTNNHPILTGKIVLAHFQEMLDYYMRLEVAELEGDIYKALKSGNKEKLEKYQKKLIEARAELAAHEQQNK
ncbi:MAG: hypothetical protein JXA92_00435 [candidate division Zixibacteria bacterium]|nr:hypothetical protein [candidate division Zixibacteria bacterium]